MMSPKPIPASIATVGDTHVTVTSDDGSVAIPFRVHRHAHVEVGDKGVMFANPTDGWVWVNHTHPHPSVAGRDPFAPRT